MFSVTFCHVGVMFASCCTMSVVFRHALWCVCTWAAVSQPPPPPPAIAPRKGTAALGALLTVPRAPAVQQLWLDNRSWAPRHQATATAAAATTTTITTTPCRSRLFPHRIAGRVICSTLHCTTQQQAALLDTTLHITPHHITLNYTALHYTT